MNVFKGICSPVSLSVLPRRSVIETIKPSFHPGKPHDLEEDATQETSDDTPQLALSDRHGTTRVWREELKRCCIRSGGCTDGRMLQTIDLVEDLKELCDGGSICPTAT